jgi:hypothetical protein
MIEGTTSRGAQVALVPLAHRENRALYIGTTADSMGNFNLRGVGPGEYRLIAWQNAPNGAYENAAFLSKYENQGQTITVVQGSHNKAAINTIP